MANLTTAENYTEKHPEEVQLPKEKALRIWDTALYGVQNIFLYYITKRHRTAYS